MKIIILSAGKGSRLMPLTKNTPKPLMDLGNGKTILETQLENIKKSGVIDEIILIVGYLGEQIEAKIMKYRKEGMNIKTIFNPVYDFSSDLISLWLSKSEMYNDFIITNGDNIFEPDVFSDLVEKNKEGIFLTTTHQDRFYRDDMKVTIKNGTIIQVSKTIPDDKISKGSVGLVLVSGENSHRAFRENMEELVRDKEYLNKHWLEIFNRMNERGVKIIPFEININKWKEIDLHADLIGLIDLIRKEQFNKKDGDIELY